VLTVLGFKAVPIGFIPMQDQGYLIGLAQLPDGATLQRSDEMRQQMVRLASSVPGVSHTVEFTGFSGLEGTNRSNAVTTFLVLAPFEERIKDPKENGFAILAEVQRRSAIDTINGQAEAIVCGTDLDAASGDWPVKPNPDPR
jgi:multidrug efflux pump subunit AcrB